MTPVGLVNEIEAAAARAWPPRETSEYDGWLLRYADGFSRRGNSVYPAAKSMLPHREKLAFCRDWFAARGLDLVIRQTPATEPGLDAVLADLGFSAEGRTMVMCGDLEDVAGPATTGMDGIAIEIRGNPAASWRSEAIRLFGMAATEVAAWQGIIERIEDDAAFALVHRGDDVVASGLAVRHRDWVGLFELVVIEAHRREGIGSQLARALLDWGRAGGAVRSYLQVVADNTPATRLYESLGFKPAYAYWYRRAPAPRR